MNKTFIVGKLVIKQRNDQTLALTSGLGLWMLRGLKTIDPPEVEGNGMGAKRP